MLDERARPDGAAVLQREENLSTTVDDRALGIAQHLAVDVFNPEVLFNPVEVERLECRLKLVTIGNDLNAVAGDRGISHGEKLSSIRIVAKHQPKPESAMSILMRSHTMSLVGVVAMGAALVSGCRGTMSIQSLLDDPGRYEGETVRVKGEVTSAFGALGQGAYRIDDGTGTMNVVSRELGAPREGTEVGVEGTFRSVFTFGDESGAVILETDRFDP